MNPSAYGKGHREGKGRRNRCEQAAFLFQKSVTGVLHHFPQSFGGLLASHRLQLILHLRRRRPRGSSHLRVPSPVRLLSLCPYTGAMVTLLSDLLVLCPSRVARRSWTSFAQQPVRFLQHTPCVVVPASMAVFNIRFRVLHVLHTRHHLGPEVSVALGRLHEGGAKTEVASWSRGTGPDGTGGGGAQIQLFQMP